MVVGTVILFNKETGHGVIRDDKGKKSFLHYSEIRSGLKNLHEGQRVCFDVRKEFSDATSLNVRLR